jgi:transposase
VAGRLHWVHSASTNLLSLFIVHPKRGKVAMDTAGVLPGFHGVAVHDGWSPYWRYQVTRALCGAHLLRELDAIADESGQGWPAGMAELLADAKTQADRARAAGAEQVDDGVRERLHARYQRLLADGHAANPPPRPDRRHRGRGRLRCSPAANLLGGWTAIGSRCCGSWTTRGCRSTTTRPSGIFAWSSCSRRSLAAGARWPAYRCS